MLTIDMPRALNTGFFEFDISQRWELTIASSNRILDECIGSQFVARGKELHLKIKRSGLDD